MKAGRLSVNELFFFDTNEGRWLRMWIWVRCKWHEWSRTQGHDGDGGRVGDTCERNGKKRDIKKNKYDRLVRKALSFYSQWAQHRC